MMKKLLPLLIASSPYLATAQTTINGTSASGYSATINIATAATASNVPIAITGSNVTWDCSALQTGTNPAVSLALGPPAGKPYASDYPNSNLNQSVTYLTNTLSNEFQSLTADSIVKWGGHVSGSSYEIYSDPEMIMKFPFSYGNNYVNNYAKTNYNAGGGVTSNQTGTNTITYEGFGTLILPSGTITSVGMIKNVRTNSLGPTTTSYLWMAVSSGEILMRYETNGGIKVNYLGSIPTGLTEKTNNAEIIIYPNVTSGQLTIKSSVAIEYYKVLSFSGKIISEEKNLNSNNVSININASPGIYIVETGSPEKKFIRHQKLIVTE